MTTMYTPDHEWINIEDHEAAVVGITHHAGEALGDVVFVDLPKSGASTTRVMWPASSNRSRPRPTSTCP
jgi:glycine cleavage system H lipoate-binding protein